MGCLGIEDLDVSRWLRPSQRARVCATGPAILEALPKERYSISKRPKHFVKSNFHSPNGIFFPGGASIIGRFPGIRLCGVGAEGSVESIDGSLIVVFFSCSSDAPSTN